MKESIILDSLTEKLDEERFIHSLGVADQAEILAQAEGYLPYHKARLAGLLHDYAKCLEADKLGELIKKCGWKIDNEELSIPQLLHAPVSAYLVKSELGINDPEILEAIRYHTIGSPEMGRLAQIIYIADHIERNRDFPGVDLARKEAAKGITPAIIAITSGVIRYNLDRGRLIHPNTLLLRNAFMRRLK